MFKYLEKFILKRIVKRVVKSILKNEEKTIDFVEDKINEISEGIEKFVGEKALILVQEAYDGLRETQK